MAREFHGIEKGLDVYAVNGDLAFRILFSNVAPTGTGDQDSAPIGSLLIRTTIGGVTIYQKKTDTTSAGDWIENGSGTQQIAFRPEKVRAVTSENVTAGVRDLTASPFTDDDGTTLVATDFAVGEFLISNSGATAVLLEVTNVSAPNVTFSTPVSAPALAEFDAFITPNYLPDPDGGENQALVQVDSAGSVGKVADIDWNFADGINMALAYAAGGGILSISSSDTVNSAIQKLDDRTLPSQSGDISAPTVLDAVLVDEVRSCVWLVTGYETATPANSQSQIIHGMNNGTSGADANSVKDDVFSKEKDGANFNFDVSVVLNGAGAAQEMRLQVDTTEAGVTYTAIRMGIAPSGY